MAVIYEVELEVDQAIEAEYRRWLKAHVAEILALPGFTGADVFDRIEPPAPADRFALVVQYRLADQQALDHYLAVHAPRLRADGLQRFTDRFRAQRRILRRAN